MDPTTASIDTAAAQLKRKLRQRKPLFAGWTSLAHPSITEILTGMEVDFIGIDLEHSTINQEQAQRIIAASQSHGVPCLPRLPSHDGSPIRRLLDSGADGIIVPNVTHIAQVEEIANSLLYPPVGKRSYGVARAQGYGFDFDRYVSGWNRRSIFLIQIESQEGVEAVEALVSHPAVDGAMVGPYDLSGSLGIPGQLSHPLVQSACRAVSRVCRARGKACGTQLVDPTATQVRAAFRAGYTFVVLGSDVFTLWKWAQRMRGFTRGPRRG